MPSHHPPTPIRAIILLLLVTVGVGVADPLHAKRLPPPKVPPVTLGGTRFTVTNTPGALGVVTATDVSSGKKLWEKKLYTVFLNPLLEADVQWIFITKLEVYPAQGGATIPPPHLRVTNERGETFALDPSTGLSKKL